MSPELKKCLKDQALLDYLRDASVTDFDYVHSSDRVAYAKGEKQVNALFKKFSAIEDEQSKAYAVAVREFYCGKKPDCDADVLQTLLGVAKGDSFSKFMSRFDRQDPIQRQYVFSVLAHVHNHTQSDMVKLVHLATGFTKQLKLFEERISQITGAKLYCGVVSMKQVLKEKPCSNDPVHTHQLYGLMGILREMLTNNADPKEVKAFLRNEGVKFTDDGNSNDAVPVPGIAIDATL